MTWRKCRAKLNAWPKNQLFVSFLGILGGLSLIAFGRRPRSKRQGQAGFINETTTAD